MTAPRLNQGSVAARGSDDRRDDAADAAALFAAMRQRIAAARRERIDSAAAPAAPASDAEGLAASLAQATAVAEVGTTVPPFAHLSWPRRLFARATGRILLYLLRVITIDQQHFNQLVLAALRSLAGDANALRAETGALRGDADALHGRLEAVGGALDVAGEQRRAMLGQLTDLSEAIAAAREQLHGQSAAIVELRDLLHGHAAAIAELRGSSALLLMQSDAVKRLLAKPPDAAGTAAAVEAGELLDCSGVDEAMRAKHGSTKERQRRYVQYFLGADNVLDVGCGAGPFLDLLRDAGVRAHGVEIDPDLALWCQERGLDVRCMDALEYLGQLEDGELGGLYCAQVVEHLRPPDLLRFIKLAARTLRPGAPIVVETLNPESLLVHYRWFWMDLTHERLVHPETLLFLLQSSGFRDVTCAFVPPPPGPVAIPPLEFPGEAPARLEEFNIATQYLNQLLYGSFDYAVIAVR